jgi:hypothetical protein
MAQLSALYPKVRLHAEGVPTPVMDRFILDTARYFCTNSLAYRETASSVTVVAGTAEYSISLAATTDEVVQPIYAEFHDSAGSVYKLNPTTDEMLREAVENWRNRTGTPKLYFAPEMGKIRLFPNPDIAGTIEELVVAKRPTNGALLLPDYLYDNWQDEIALGVAAKILMVPEKDWSNWTIGYRYWKMFEADVKEVRRKVRYGLTGAPMQVVIPRIT